MARDCRPRRRHEPSRVDAGPSREANAVPVPRAGDVVEIAPDGGGGLPSELVVNCFRAARTRRVVLILNRVPYTLVNAALERHVPFPCLAYAGVRYFSWSDVDELQAAFAEACTVWIATREGRQRIAALGWRGPVRDPRRVVTMDAAEPTGATEPTAAGALRRFSPTGGSKPFELALNQQYSLSSSRSLPNE